VRQIRRQGRRTISIIREGVFGFPLQSAFDLTAVRATAARSPRSRRWRSIRRQEDRRQVLFR